MKKTVKAILISLFTAVVAVSVPFSAQALGNGAENIFGVTFTLDNHEYTVKCEHQSKLLGSEWYFERPAYLETADNSGLLYLVLPHDAASVQLRADTQAGVYLDGTQIKDGDAVFLADGTEHSLLAGESSYTLKVRYGSDIPVVSIDTQSGSLDNIYADKIHRESACMTVSDNGRTLYSRELDFIKGRGNFTWDAVPKKSFSIRLIEDFDLLGMGTSKNYALLANHVDMTMVRNKLICDFAGSIGIPFSPQAEYVELYINNEYMGLYALTEKVEVSESRVDIYNLEQETINLNLYDRVQDAALMGDQRDVAQYNLGSCKWVDVKNNPEDITGGYIIELELQERYFEEVSGFVSDYGQTVTLASPQYASREQVEYIKDYYQQFEDAVMGKDGYNSLGKHYSEYVDMDSVVKMHLIQEYAKNLDAAVTSFYFYKDTGGKLVAAPIWDMDSGFGRFFERYGTDFNNPEGLWVSGGRMVGTLVEKKHTILALLWQHEDYRQAVFSEWHTNIAPKTESLINSFENLSSRLEKSIANDRRMWLGGDFTVQSIDRWREESGGFMTNFILRRSEFLSGIYSPDHLRVTYDGNGGLYRTLDGNLYPAGTSATVMENGFRYDGADFIGWNTKPDGSGTEYQPGDALSITEDTTLYAQWSLHPVAQQPAEGGITGLIKRIIRKIFG